MTKQTNHHSVDSTNINNENVDYVIHRTECPTNSPDESLGGFWVNNYDTLLDLATHKV